MEHHGCHVIIMAIFKSVHALLGLIVPYFDLSIVSTRHDVRSFAIMAEINAVYTSGMTYQTVVGVAFGG